MFGRGRSELDKGLDAFAARHWRNARKHLEDAVIEAPRAIGDFHLGLLYWRGLGGEKDHRAAVHHFRRAAEAGHAAAQTALGLAVQAGVGAPKDEAQARALFRSAAGAGDVEAMTQLAALSDKAEALALLRRASDAGHPPAMRLLADAIMGDDPIEALGLLYAHVSLTGNHAVSRHAEDLARELRADEIDAALKRGRVLLKQLKRQDRRTR
ncbi:MAG TPA: hypothetical protein VG841_11425 [Caulobacterales bacterium]|nr:hypothetical protein [Caulobacterales bacterium]